MSKTRNKSDFNAFRALHEHGLLRLANAWDVGSARLIESLGAKAIATTSAGMAWAAGYADGNRMPPGVVVATAESIARVINVPLSVDVEGGYSSEPTEVAAFAIRLAEVGVVGVNLEDGAEPAELLAHKIEAVKNALTTAGLDIFVNARTDVYLKGLVDPPTRVDEVLNRAKLYAAAGANGLFVPAIVEHAEMRQISGNTKLPLNVMAWDGLPAPDQLLKAGVRRLSAGSGIAARVCAQTQALARQFLEEGSLTGEQMAFADLQKLFA